MHIKLLIRSSVSPEGGWGQRDNNFMLHKLLSYNFHNSPEMTKVYVGNLDDRTRKEDLEDSFSKYDYIPAYR